MERKSGSSGSENEGKKVDLGQRAYSLQMWVDQDRIDYVRNVLQITDEESLLKGRISDEVI